MYLDMKQEFDKKLIPQAKILLLYQREQQIEVQKFMAKELAYKQI